MQQISIVGFGRFGKVLYKLLKNDFSIVLYDKKKNSFDGYEINNNTRVVSTQKEIYKSEIIFFAVPISSFRKVITLHKKYFLPHHLLIDVLSVKVYPESVFKEQLKNARTNQALLLHPMFGPDSSKNGFFNLNIIIDKFTCQDDNYRFWKEYFHSKDINVVEMSSKEHDRLAASSQGLTHFIGRMLKDVGFKRTDIDSIAAKKLLEVEKIMCNDSWQLFFDLQHYNPYTNRMRAKLGESFTKLHNRLLPEFVEEGFITFGIQGGIGSFNEQALFKYLQTEKISKHKIKYLYTSDRVLQYLYKGYIDRGILAIHNSVGGIVDESIEAMANYQFSILKKIAIKISHSLMIHKDSEIGEIRTIMSHPQVFAQCKVNLLGKYPHLKQEIGKGQMVDHSMIAKMLSQDKLSKNIAVMGGSHLADLYNLKIIESNLQDSPENYTTFLLIKRK